MSKYHDLKEPSGEDTFTGVRYAEQCVVKEQGAIIEGFPACPECGAVLNHDFLNSRWCCPDCCTEWTGSSLVEALQNERAEAKLHEEETST